MTGQNRSAELARAVVPILAKYAPECDAQATFPQASLDTLRESGLMGLLVPTRFGGRGGDLADLVEIAQILAAGCGSTAMIWAMHCQQVETLVRHGSPRLHDRLLPSVASGELYLASVTTEPGTGGHLLSAGAPLTAEGRRLRFTRDAPIVTGGAYADGFLITLRESPDAPANRVTLVFAARDQLKITSRGAWNPLGMRGTHSIGMKIDGCVDEEQIVGAPGRFREVAMDSLIVTGHIAWAACWLGLARAALTELVGLLRSPRRPRSIDLESDLLAARLARVRIDQELVSAYLSQLVEQVNRHRAAGQSLDTPATQIQINTLKVAAAELTFASVDRLVQLAGMSGGYLKNAPIPLERHFRDLRSAALNYSNDRLLVATGRLSLLDREVRLAGRKGA
ncbi:acyl-CoA dehydrogenase family protein [Nonomuraea sp. NPDC050227]|uniref:acyl-CoA dehydrogenase family protein n=1 Tax=Nonomuraea sp. NPDC050227 TaxID=3364360 RepID=UPI0037B55808